MNDAQIMDIPAIYPELLAKSAEIGFTMPSDLYIGTLLKTLMSSKPGGVFLELGTGIGLSLCWMIEGMDNTARLITIDNDPKLTKVARHFFAQQARLDILCQDGGEWIRNYQGPMFDLVFADAWPGKYSELEKLLDLIKPGGFYIIDDMRPQPNWPEEHAEKAAALIAYLEGRADLRLTKMDWSSGVVLATKVVV